MHTRTHAQWYFYMCVYLGVFLYKGGYLGCSVGSPSEGAKGNDIVNKSKIPLRSKNRACFINLEIVCLSLALLVCLPCISKIGLHKSHFLFVLTSCHFFR